MGVMQSSKAMADACDRPIVALIGGVKAPPGRIMGHAGAFASLGEDPAHVKHQALKDAGVPMVSHPTQFPDLLKRTFTEAGKDINKMTSGGMQRRGYHTMRQRPRARRPVSVRSKQGPYLQRHGLHLESGVAKQLLRDQGISIVDQEQPGDDKRYLAFTVDRSNRCPAIIASPTAKPEQIFARARWFPYNYGKGPSEEIVRAVFRQLQLSAAPPAAMAALGKTINALAETFKAREAYAMSTILSGTEDGGLHVEQAQVMLDDSAYKSGMRQENLFATRDKANEDPDEVEAEKDGIVYIKLSDPEANIGTLINGAGLAMNAIDALGELGAKPTNFLDTGGKATSATIKKSFQLILNDVRVKVIFVNIFGGLTLCDMIAEGIMLAFRDLRMEVPVVVRLRGTDEARGQQMISESGLPLHAFDDFQEAVEKCKELAAGR